MVDPTEITNFNRTTNELEELLLFCIAVAGKTAKQISIALEKLLTTQHYYQSWSCELKEFGGKEFVCESLDLDASPFAKIRWLAARNKLFDVIKDSGLGQHSKLTSAFTEVAKQDFDLTKVTTEQLESIKGIGPKTSRFFILHSRKTDNIACLDTHILRWLRNKGYDVPKGTPSNKNYLRLEKAFVSCAKEMKVPVAELDLKIWNESSIRSGKR